MLNILVTNDDGINATGLNALVQALAFEGHNVHVVAPEGNRSANGHKMTMDMPVRVYKTNTWHGPYIHSWACTGTPVDCVKIGMSCKLNFVPEIVISGVNHGYNLGNDVFYSGTVAAALDAHMNGLPSIAISADPCVNFAVAAGFAVRSIPIAQTELCLNINVPAGAVLDSDIRLARLGRQLYSDVVDVRQDPRGKEYFWLAGTLNDKVPPSAPLVSPLTVSQQMDYMRGFPTERELVTQGMASMVPLHYDLTNYVTLEDLNSILRWDLDKN